MDKTKSMKRKVFTQQFKDDALELLAKGGKKQDELERDLGISAGCLSRWRREKARDGVAAFPGQGRLRPYDEELARLRKENLQLRQERDLLKKAMGIVARGNA